MPNIFSRLMRRITGDGPNEREIEENPRHPIFPDPPPKFARGVINLPDGLIEFVKYWEGKKLEAYWDADGKVWTIGYGTTRYRDGSPVKKGDRISQENADYYLQQDLINAIKIVRKHVIVDLTDKEVLALASFVYNVGPGKEGVKDGLVALKRGGPSTLLKKINLNQKALAASQFDLWVNAGGKPLKGLRRRRRAEYYIWTGADVSTAISSATKDFP